MIFKRVSEKGIAFVVNTAELPEPQESYAATFADVKLAMGMVVSIFGQVPTIGKRQLASVLEVSIARDLFLGGVWPSFVEFKQRVELFVTASKLDMAELLRTDELDLGHPIERHLSLCAHLVSAYHFGGSATLNFYGMSAKDIHLAKQNVGKHHMGSVRPLVQVHLPTIVLAGFLRIWEATAQEIAGQDGVR